MENKFKPQQYRDNLAEDLKDIRNTDPEKAQEVLGGIQTTNNYTEAKAKHVEEHTKRRDYKQKVKSINRFDEEKRNTIDEKHGLIREKINKDQLLTRDDIAFIYEYEGSYREFISKRNPMEDVSFIYECTQEQIATNISEINDGTKVYIGGFETGVFKKLSKVDHIYKKFPGEKLDFIEYKKDITYPETSKQWKDSFIKEGIDLYHEYDNNTLNALDSMEHTYLSPKQRFARFSYHELGLSGYSNYMTIVKRAEDLGLELCKQDDGPKLSLSIKLDTHTSMYFTKEASVDDKNLGWVKIWKIDDNANHQHFSSEEMSWISNPRERYDKKYWDDFVFRLP